MILYIYIKLRKKLIKSGYIKPDYDLTFTKLCLTKHPKSSNLWYHRYMIILCTIFINNRVLISNSYNFNVYKNDFRYNLI